MLSLFLCFWQKYNRNWSKTSLGLWKYSFSFICFLQWYKQYLSFLCFWVFIICDFLICFMYLVISFVKVNYLSCNYKKRCLSHNTFYSLIFWWCWYWFYLPPTLSSNRFSAHNKTWSVLETLLRSGEGLAVKLKDGRYPYGDAPSGFQVQLAHLLTQDKSARWTMKVRKLFLFGIGLVVAMSYGIYFLSFMFS